MTPRVGLRLISCEQVPLERFGPATQAAMTRASTRSASRSPGRRRRTPGVHEPSRCPCSTDRGSLACRRRPRGSFRSTITAPSRASPHARSRRRDRLPGQARRRGVRAGRRRRRRAGRARGRRDRADPVAAGHARAPPRSLARLAEVARELVSDLRLDQILDCLLDAARELTGARYAALGSLTSNAAGRRSSSPPAFHEGHQLTRLPVRARQTEPIAVDHGRQLLAHEEDVVLVRVDHGERSCKPPGAGREMLLADHQSPTTSFRPRRPLDRLDVPGSTHNAERPA
jgi:hypothetical protein